MKLKMIAGLGNPGKEYENTYHNAGMLAVIRAAERQGDDPVAWKTHKKLFRWATAPNLVFVLPLTFMNESGQAVKEAIKKFGVAAEDLVVVHDESDMALGTYKISAGRNAAGHKGVQSIMDALGSKEFTRARIGIRDADETGRKKAEEFVLKEIRAKDREALEEIFEEVARAIL